MAKKLSDVLRGTNSSGTRPGRTGSNPGVDYSSKMDDERDFVNAHDTEEFEDRVGNGSDVYNASNIKQTSDSRHGHTPEPKSQNQYRQNNEQVLDDRPVYTNTTTGQTSRNLPSDLRTRMGLQSNGTSLAVATSPRPLQRPSNTAVTTSPRPLMRPVREEAEGEDVKLNLSDFKAKHVPGLYNFDHFEHPNGSFIQISPHGHGVYQDSSGNRREFNSHSELRKLFEEAEGDDRVQPKDTRGKRLRMITGEVKESNNGSPKTTASEQARARFDKKQERREMNQDRENDN